MRRISSIPGFERPREKLKSRGASSLSDVELIAAIIGKGIKGRDVLRLSGDINKEIKQNFNNLSYESLKKIKGMGDAKICQILAAFELARRYLIKDIVKITKPGDVLPLIDFLKDRKQEYFVCISMNGAGEVLGNRIVTVGLLDQSLVHPREVFADPIAERAASVILVHNHPSGSLKPSREDISVTKQLVEAGKILGIKVFDHIIISRKGYFSMQENGIIFTD